MQIGVHTMGRKIAQVVAIAFAIFVTPQVASAQEIRVSLNESTVFVFDEDVATIAVANPSIADVSVHNGRVLLVVGRSFGTTNMVVLNSDGKAIGTKRIRVTSVGGSANVTLVKGDQNQIISFSCAPRCERAVVPGDQSVTSAEFDKVHGQNDARSKSAAEASE